MKEAIYNRLNVLKSQLDTTSDSGAKHSTDVGELREEHFRSFLIDLFPYYDSFKGNIFGKSCDFILADNKSHPKLRKLVNKKEFYPYVFKSLVDTVIDLKGIYNKQSLNEGIEQAFRIKSFVRDRSVQRGMVRHFDTPKDYLSEMTIRHGLIFIKGGNKKIINDIMNSCFSPQKYSSQINILQKFINDGLLPLKEKQTQHSIEKRVELENILFNFETFYKLPDFFYFIEDDSFIFINKGKMSSNLKPWHFLDEKSKEISNFSIQKFNDNGLLHLLATIEMFSNERDNFQLRSLFFLEISKIIKSFQLMSIPLDTPLIGKEKWIVEHKFKNPCNPNPNIISNLEKLINVKPVNSWKK